MWLNAQSEKQHKKELVLFGIFSSEEPENLRQVDNNDKESEEKSSEANSSSNRDVVAQDPLDSNKTEYNGSKSLDDKHDKDDKCSDRKASKSQCREEENNVKEPLNDYLMDLGKAKHVGCSLRKSADGESIENGSGEGSSFESERSPKKQKTNHALGKQHEVEYCETSSSEEIQKETTQENIVQVNQTIGAGKVDRLNPEGLSLQLGMGQCSSSVASTYSFPLEYELEKLWELKNKITKFYEFEKLQLKSNHEKELAELVAEMNRKYEAKCQDAEAAFQSKRVEIDTHLNKVVKNKILGDAIRSKRPDMSPFDPEVLRVQSGAMQFQGQLSVGSSASSSRAQVSRIHQQPPHQIVHQPANLLSTRPLSNTNPSSILVRPPPINPITPSIRPSTSGPMTPFTRVNINSTPSNKPPPNIKSITPSSRPPTSNNPNTAFARNPRGISGLRAPAPHMRPFTRSPHLWPLHMSPHIPTNHNGHPTQNSPTTRPFSSLAAAQTSSHSPAVSLALPPLHSSHPSEQHPPARPRISREVSKAAAATTISNRR